MNDKKKEWNFKIPEEDEGRKKIIPPMQGLIIAPREFGIYTEEEVVKTQPPKSNGREICQKLRQIRVELAALNGIPFFSMPCKNKGPCAGTCPACDNEMRYLMRALNKIPAEQRRYPDQYWMKSNEDK